MAENDNAGNKHINNNYLKDPPQQTVPGVVLYHEKPEMDERIRQVATLIEGGYDLNTICQMVERGPTQVKTYFRQIRTARLMYIQAFPEEFDSGLAGLHMAIQERRDLDRLLRREYYHSTQDSNPSNRVGMLKLIMRNMRELEELTGLSVQRIEHRGEIGVKDDMRTLLDLAPPDLREGYLDALAALVHAAEQCGEAQSSDSE